MYSPLMTMFKHEKKRHKQRKKLNLKVVMSLTEQADKLSSNERVE